MLAIMRLDVDGRQVGKLTHVCHPDHARPLCGADQRQPGNWQTDLAATPNCKRCLARHPEVAPMFLEVRRETARA